MSSKSADSAKQVKHLSGMREDVVSGLSCSPKILPCKLLYDKRGSLLF
ncbi:MAG: L-histidine N(alpha)-methyltransferase, partial [Candidatus Latescibacterota bacterium]